MPTRAAAHSAVTPSCGQADHRCGLVLLLMVTETTWLAASGRNRMMSKCQLLGSAFSRIGMMNITAITIAIAPAVCRTSAPTPYAMSATRVTNSTVPMIAASTVDGWMVSQLVTTRLPPRVHRNCDGPTWTRCRHFIAPFPGILAVWNSEALTPVDAYTAWTAKNAANAVISEVTSVTDVNAIAFAA